MAMVKGKECIVIGTLVIGTSQRENHLSVGVSQKALKCCAKESITRPIYIQGSFGNGVITSLEFYRMNFFNTLIPTEVVIIAQIME